MASITYSPIKTVTNADESISSVSDLILTDDTFTAGGVYQLTINDLPAELAVVDDTNATLTINGEVTGDVNVPLDTVVDAFVSGSVPDGWDTAVTVDNTPVETTATGLTIDAVSGDNVIGAADKESAIEITGTAEAGSTVVLTLTSVDDAATVEAQKAALDEAKAALDDATAAVAEAQTALDDANAAAVEADIAAAQTAFDEATTAAAEAQTAFDVATAAAGENTPIVTEPLAAEDGTWSYTLPADLIVDGSLTISAVATDAAGTASEPVEDVVTINTAAPNAPTIDVVAEDDIIDADEADAGVTVTGTTVDGSTVSVVVGDNEPAEATVDGTKWSYELPSDVIADGQLKITASTTLDGNESDVATKEVNVDLTPIAPTIEYSTTTANEDEKNNGGIADTITLTLKGDTFYKDIIGKDLNSDAELIPVVSNVPEGLTAKLEVIDETTAELTFTGEATQHASANDVKDVQVSFLETYFSSDDQDGFVLPEGADQTLSISFKDSASLTFDGAFKESLSNDGSVNGKVTLTLHNDTFKDAKGADLSDLVDFAPKGLTPHLTVVDETHAELTFTGKAVNNDAKDSGDFSISFTDADFASGATPEDLGKSGQLDLGIKFIEPRLSWSDKAFNQDGDTADLEGTSILTLEDATFVKEGLDLSKFVRNLPEGVTAELKVTDSTHAELTLTGHANTTVPQNIEVTLPKVAFASRMVVTDAKSELALTFDDKTAPDAPVIDTIASDNAIDDQEKAAGVTISGTAEAGSTITLTFGTDGNTTVNNGSADLIGDAQTALDDATTAKDDAQKALDEATAAAETAQADLDAANTAAEEAQTALDEAKTTAESATATPEDATLAEEAQTALDDATTAATDAQTAFDDATAAVETAQADLEAATTAFDEAQTAFDDASAGTDGSTVDETPVDETPVDETPVDDTTVGVPMNTGETAQASEIVDVINTVKDITVDKDGNWSYKLTAKDYADYGSELVSAVATDKAGNPSSAHTVAFEIVDSTAPDAPVIDKTSTITKEDKVSGVSITGTAEANAEVTLTFGEGDTTATDTVTADANGKWEHELDDADYATVVYADGAATGTLSLSAVAKDASNLESTAETAEIKVADYTAPDAPTVVRPTAALEKGSVLTGTAEALSTVTLTFGEPVDDIVRTVTTNADGEWSLIIKSGLLGEITDAEATTVTATATDAAQNESAAKTIPLAPLAVVPEPTIDVVAEDDAINSIEAESEVVVTGTTEKGTTVTLSINGETPVDAEIGEDGTTWSYILPADLIVDKATLTIVATAEDAEGTQSKEATTEVAVDLTAVIVEVAAPIIDTVAEDDTIDAIEAEGEVVVTGTSEADTTVSVIVNGSDAADAEVDADGNWSYTLPAAVIVDGTLTIVAIAKNADGIASVDSDAHDVTVDLTPIDTTPPEAPGVPVIVDGDNVINKADAATAIKVELSLPTDAVEGDAADLLLDDVSLTSVPLSAADITAGLVTLTVPAGTFAGEKEAKLTATITDANLNASLPSELVVTLDTVSPVAPTLSLINDTATAADGISTDGTVLVSGLETGASWVYSIDGGAVFKAGTGDKFVLPIGTYAANSVQVKQTDAHDNEGAVGKDASALTIIPAEITAKYGAAAVTPYTLTGTSGKDVFVFNYETDSINGALANFGVVTIQGYDKSQGDTIQFHSIDKPAVADGTGFVPLSVLRTGANNDVQINFADSAQQGADNSITIVGVPKTTGGNILHADVLYTFA